MSERHKVSRRSHRRYKPGETLYGYAFIAPWLIGFFCFAAGPVLASLWFSFCSYEVLTPPVWIGLQNYRELATGDPLFWKSLYNTLVYALGSLPLCTAAALGLALLLNQRLPGMGFFRTLFFLPSLVPIVASCILWVWVLNPRSGILNALLAQIGIDGPGWLLSEFWSKPALILMSVWGVGGAMIIFLAGLQDVPRQLYEAARIDGASTRQQFIHVTWAMLSATTFFNIVVGGIGVLQLFTQAYVMTHGGPVDSTLFYAVYLFKTAFEHLRMGYASAMAWILFLLILALTGVQFALAKRWVHYEGGDRR